MNKKPQKEVKYTDYGTKDEHCSICDHYVNSVTCAVVSGSIRPYGWCKLFKKAESK